MGRIVDHVFSDAAYQQSIRQSLLADLWAWIVTLFIRLVQAITRTPGAASVARLTLYAMATLILLMVGYKVVRHYMETRRDSQVRFGGGDVADLWKASESAAAGGDYTAAAHLLYAALVRMLVLRGALRYHSSKTTGDYVRELRRSSGVMTAPFIDFVRAYEVVVYRDGTCDAPRYTTLRGLAEPIVRPVRAAA